MKVLRDAWALLGLPGAAGIVFIGGALWAQSTLMPAQQAEVDQAASDNRALRHRLQTVSASRTTVGAETSGPKAPAAPEAAWALLWQSLPVQADRVALQDGVLQCAAREGLQIDSLQYRGERVPITGAEGLWRQRMAMPIQGPYSAVRRWVACLQPMPSVGIDALTLERRDPASDMVQAQVSVSLWWRLAGRP